MKTSKLIRLMEPSILDEDIQGVVNVLKSGMLVQGEQVDILEEKIKKIIGVEHAIAVSNGTASLHLALLALEVGPGDEVIVPAFSYVATANVVELVGAKPVFVDVEIDTLNVDVNQVEALINDRTKAIIPVHEFGLACDIEVLSKLCKKHNIFLIEDAACALGAEDNGKPVGSFGEFGSFSFHPRKNITSGEGGAITTSNEELAMKVRLLRNHGMCFDNGESRFVSPGYNYRLTDIQASLINSQIPRLKDIVRTKRDIVGTYSTLLNNELIILPKEPFNKKHVWQTFHIILPFQINRNKLIKTLRKAGVATNYGAQCIPDLTYYKSKYKLDASNEFQNAYRAYHHGLALPLHEKLSEEDIEHVSNNLNKAVEDVRK